MKRLSIVVITVMVFGSLADAAAAAGPGEAGRPVRSGSILGGFFVMAGDRGPDCVETPDCRVWLESDCDASLAVDPGPALYTSIVDVADLAGLRRQRRLGVFLQGGYGVGWGGITVQFWDAACNEMKPRSLNSRRTAEAGPPALKFRIPRGAEWMTLAAWDTVRLEWALR